MPSETWRQGPMVGKGEWACYPAKFTVLKMTNARPSTVQKRRFSPHRKTQENPLRLKGFPAFRPYLDTIGTPKAILPPMETKQLKPFSG